MGVIDKDAIYSFVEARKIVGFGETFFRKQIKTGALQARRAGASVRIKGEDLIKWFDALPLASGTTPSPAVDEPTGGKPSGSRTAEERGLTSALASTNR